MLHAIRKAHASDLDDVVALYTAVGEASAGTDNDPLWKMGVYPTVELIASEIEEGHVFLLFVDEELAGAVVMNRGIEAGYENVAWKSPVPLQDSVIMHLFGIHPDFKGQHLARPFLAEVERALKAQGERVLRFDVVGANTGAQRVYEHLGYAPCGHAWLEYEDYQGDFCFFEKELSLP